jgi:hypothetical protein
MHTTLSVWTAKFVERNKSKMRKEGSIKVLKSMSQEGLKKE